MNKRIYLTFAVAALAFSGCNKLSGEVGTLQFSVSPHYEKLIVSDGFEVEFIPEAGDVLVTADENLLSKVEVSKADGELKIGLKAFASSHGSRLKAVIPFSSDIEEIALSGGSTLCSSLPIAGKNLEISLSDASLFESELYVDEIDMNFTGESTAKVSGSCDELDADLSGGSEIASQHDSHYRFSSNRLKGSMSGSSKAALHCDGSIEVSLSGSSIIRYTGDAQTDKSSLTGGSKIVRDIF